MAAASCAFRRDPNRELGHLQGRENGKRNAETIWVFIAVAYARLEGANPTQIVFGRLIGFGRCPVQLRSKEEDS